ncbi:MAG TPA: hypothetical protein VHG28_22400 [Longimicrobiaceae bacterium]|nr:hypothetical protein [Longimicrobiaceae bacterium]
MCFFLHEEVLPNRVGIPEKVVPGVYGSLALLYLFHFRDAILRAEPALLALALGCFAVSVLADARFAVATRETLLLEDGAKLLGIATWLAYFTRVGSAVVRRELSRAGT